MRVAVIGKGEDGWKRDREGRIFLCEEESRRRRRRKGEG